MTHAEIIKGLKAVRTIHNCNYAPCIDAAIKELKAREWIPVSERLPEVHKDVLIYLSSDEICIGCYNSHRLPFSNNAIGWGASYTHNWCSNDVIAWMPLPKPYEPQEDEKINCKTMKCENCKNHNYCDYEPQESEDE